MVAPADLIAEASNALLLARQGAIGGLRAEPARAGDDPFETPASDSASQTYTGSPQVNLLDTSAVLLLQSAPAETSAEGAGIIGRLYAASNEILTAVRNEALARQPENSITESGDNADNHGSGENNQSLSAAGRGGEPDAANEHSQPAENPVPGGDLSNGSLPAYEAIETFAGAGRV